MKTFIVIPNYFINEEVEQLAIQAVKSFKETADCEVVCVDDASPRDPCFLRKHCDQLIIRGTNGGFAKTCNTGLRYVMDVCPNDAYVVLANNDIKVYPGWLEEFKKLEPFDMAGGLGFRGEPDWGKKNCNYISEGGMLEDWLFPGGFFITKLSVLREIGLYDENYEHGGVEDIDLFYVAKKANKRLVMTPKVLYGHKEGATRYSDGEKKKQSDAILRNEAYFEKKYGIHPIKHLNQILCDRRINL